MIAVPIGPRVQRYVAAAAPSYLAALGSRPSTGSRRTTPASATGSRAARSSTGNSCAAGRSCGSSRTGRLSLPPSNSNLARRLRAWAFICTFEEFLREALDRGELMQVLADWRVELLGPVPLLSEPQHACAASRLRRFYPRRFEPCFQRSGLETILMSIRARYRRDVFSRAVRFRWRGSRRRSVI